MVAQNFLRRAESPEENTAKLTIFSEGVPLAGVARAPPPVARGARIQPYKTAFFSSSFDREPARMSLKVVMPLLPPASAAAATYASAETSTASPPPPGAASQQSQPEQREAAAAAACAASAGSTLAACAPAGLGDVTEKAAERRAAPARATTRPT